MKGRLFLLLLFFGPVAFGQSSFRLIGRVLDTNRKPLEFATVSISETNQYAFTDSAGRFGLLLPARYAGTISLKVSMVGKQSVTINISQADTRLAQLIVLNDLSLTLKEVNVSAQRRQGVSNSSIVFDRQALDQVQAYSLADVLNNLPGKKAGAPDLQYRQLITLRSSANDNVQSAINSMGVAIYVDGMRQSNDANMQMLNLGMRGVRGATVVNHKDPYTGNPSYDTPLSGLDIRNIPVDNIESIEVVSGVASAKYGELTDGAIIVNRMAGRTPYVANIRLNGSSTNASISKGFKLGGRAGAINANFNYLNSIQNPTNSQKNYGRVSTGIMWTTNLYKHIRNTFSADYSAKLDKYRPDPDDDEKEDMYTKERRFSFSNRTSFQVDQPWLQRAILGISYDAGYQETYRQVNINKAPFGIADKDTTGIYEGRFIPGNFYSVQHILGKPYNGSANLDLLTAVKTGGITHAISYGANGYFNGNSGQGVIADPDRPFQNTTGNKSDRPYPFDLVRPIVNFGFYAEDQIKFKLFNRQANVTAGARYDLQNGYPTFAPRINGSYQFTKRWSVRGAFGVSTKAPSMSYRYPGPTYFDIPLINIYNGKVNESLYLVYTRKIEHDNSYLKPSRATQLELGLSGDYGWFNTSIYGYYKKNRDGYGDGVNYIPMYLPEFTYTLVPGGKPIYQQTGTTKLYGGLNDLTIANNVQSDNSGIEWLLSTRKIAAIQTAFNMSTSVSYSRYNSQANTMRQAADSYIQAGATAWYGIYPGEESENLVIMSKFNTDTHIPKLGFVVSLIADVFWKNIQRYPGKNTYPVAYVDKNGSVVPIENFDPNNKDYGYLALAPDNAKFQLLPPFIYTSLSLRLSKEIRKKMRISLYAYNVFDKRIQHFDEVTRNVTLYSDPVNVGGEVAFRF